MTDRELFERLHAEQRTDNGDLDGRAGKRLSRRKWLRRCLAGVVGAGVAVGGYARYVEPYWIEVVRRAMPVRGLPSELAGKTLVQISDLHIGPIVRDSYIRGTLEIVSELAPDILVLTGDFVTWRGPEQIGQTVALLKDLSLGRLGTFAITGNHDFGSSPWSDESIADRLTDRLTGLGIRMLRNDSAVVAGLRIIGVDDYWSPRFDLDQALSGFSPEQPAIALCHNPDAVIDENWHGFRGWILSGHTHGGQVRLPFCRAPRLPVRHTEFAAGQFTLNDGRTLYVNRALGYSHPVRFNVRPEITVFELQPAHS